MNDMFTFEPTALELMLERVKPGSTVSALRLLTVLESEDEDAVSDAFDTLLEKGVGVDISQLPANFGSGETEKRLRWEDKISNTDDLLSQLSADDPLAIYLGELAAIPAQGDPNLLAGDLLSGDNGAAGKLMNLFLSRCVELALECTGHGVLLQDLLQEASLGLWQSISSYQGGDITAHVEWWIRQSLARAVVMQARESGVARNLQSAMEAYREADRVLLTKLGRNATVEEIAAHMGVTPQQAELAGDALRSAVELEKKAHPAQSEEQEDQAVEDTAYFQSRQHIAELLSSLSEEEAKLLSMRYGLEGGVPETPQSVGQKLGMTADQVVAMEAAALAKLREN